MGFNKLVNIIVLSICSTKMEHLVGEDLDSQIIYKPGSVIEDVIYLDMFSQTCSSG